MKNQACAAYLCGSLFVLGIEKEPGIRFFYPAKRLNAYTKLIEILDKNIVPQAK